MSTAPAPGRAVPAVVYNDFAALEWVNSEAPCRWQGCVSVYFCEVPLSRLQRPQSRLRPERLDYWMERLRTGRSIPPCITHITETGQYYIRDGNHRHEALMSYFGAHRGRAKVRIAIAHPNPGYAFVRRSLGSVETGKYSAYMLQKIGSTPTPANWRKQRVDFSEGLLQVFTRQSTDYWSE